MQELIFSFQSYLLLVCFVSCYYCFIKVHRSSQSIYELWLFPFSLSGVHGLSNRLLNSPWGKLVQGKSLFSDSMKSALSSDTYSEEDMIQDLLQLLLTKDQ